PRRVDGALWPVRDRRYVRSRDAEDDPARAGAAGHRLDRAERAVLPLGSPLQLPARVLRPARGLYVSHRSGGRLRLAERVPAGRPGGRVDSRLPPGRLTPAAVPRHLRGAPSSTLTTRRLSSGTVSPPFSAPTIV